MGVYYFWTGAGCWALDFLAKKLGRVTDAPVTAVCRDILADHLFAAVGANVVKLFAGGRREGRWRSGTMVMQAQAPLAWVQADGDQSPSNPCRCTGTAMGSCVTRRCWTASNPSACRRAAGWSRRWRW